MKCPTKTSSILDKPARKESGTLKPMNEVGDPLSLAPQLSANTRWVTRIGCDHLEGKILISETGTEQR